LVKLLEHPNGWHRETAARLLYTRIDGDAKQRPLNARDEDLIGRLETTLKSSPSSLGRMHALFLLIGIIEVRMNEVDAQNRAMSIKRPSNAAMLDLEGMVLTVNRLAKRLQSNLLAGLRDTDGLVRCWAVTLSEGLVSVPGDPLHLNGEFRERLIALTNDPDPLVRYQLALELRMLGLGDEIPMLAGLLRRDADRTPISSATLQSAAGFEAKLFDLLSHDREFLGRSQGREVLIQLARVTAARAWEGETAQIISYISMIRDPVASFALIRALGDGLQSRSGTLEKADPEGKLNSQIALARLVAAEANAPEPGRIEAIRLLGYISYAESGATLLALLGGNEPPALQSTALATLARFTEPSLGGELTKRWSGFSARLKSEVLTALLARPERTGALLAALEGGVIKPTELSSTQTKPLLAHRDASVRERATKLLGNTLASRDSVVKAFLPALQLRGDAAKGKALYTERCVSCHRAGTEGFALGPDLVTVKNTGAEKLLVNILDPNREVAPQYIAFTVELKDDESLVGLIANETTTHVTLRMASGIEKTLPRTTIRGMKSSGQSLMPEGLEQNLTVQGMADLIEFVMTLK